MLDALITDSSLANVHKYLKDICVQCYNPCFPSLLNEEYMKEIKEAGIIVNPYTVFVSLLIYNVIYVI